MRLRDSVSLSHVSQTIFEDHRQTTAVKEEGINASLVVPSSHPHSRINSSMTGSKFNR